MHYVQDAPLSLLTKLYVDRVAAADGALRGIIAASSSTAAVAVGPCLTPAETSAAFQDDPLVEPPADDTRVTLPFFRLGPRQKVHLVSLPPRLAFRGDCMPCGRRITPEGRFLSAIPPDASRCKGCGSNPTWATAVAMASSLAPHDDSD